MDIGDVTTTVQIHTNTGSISCPECEEILHVEHAMPITRAINHLLDHGYRLLHVGSQWSEDREGNSVSHTVAILGK